MNEDAPDRGHGRGVGVQRVDPGQGSRDCSTDAPHAHRSCARYSSAEHTAHDTEPGSVLGAEG